jgi:hypothetical protein
MTGEWRMCIDYRALNFRMVRNTHPIPHIQDYLHRLGKASHLSSLELTSDHWQVRITSQKPYSTHAMTGMNSWLCLWINQYTFDLQGLMNSILRPYIDRFILVIFDDITSHSNSTEEDRDYVHLVLEALQKYKLYARPKKCSFDQKEVEFCGHVVAIQMIILLNIPVDFHA